MRTNLFLPLRRIVAMPWQQRVNQSGLLLTLVLPTMLLVPPLVVGVLLLPSFDAGPAQRFAMHALIGFFVAAAAIGLWGLTIASILEQNHPVLARLVPGHAAGLRRMVFAGWGVLVAAGGLLPGLATGHPFILPAAVGLALAGSAVCVRWPMLFLALLPLIYVPSALMQVAVRQATTWWMADSVPVAAALAAVSLALLTLIVRGGGARHAAAYAARSDRNRRLQARMKGDSSADLAGGPWRGLSGGPYFWWLRRQLARPDSSVRARLALGLGPSLHWTTRLATIFWSALGFGAGCLLAVLLSPDMGRGMLSGAAIGVLFSVAIPALQVHAALWQTRGEQALLVLLPGGPQGGRLNRWLGVRMSVHFALGLLGAVALSSGLFVLRHTLSGGWMLAGMDNAALVCAAAVLPLSQLVWRRWDRVAAPTGLAPFVPLLWAGGLGLSLVVLHALLGVSVELLGACCFAASLLWCARRWWRAAHEPSHLPVGRSAA